RSVEDDQVDSGITTAWRQALPWRCKRGLSLSPFRSSPPATVGSPLGSPLSVPVLTPCPPLRSGEGELRARVEYTEGSGYSSPLGSVKRFPVTLEPLAAWDWRQVVRLW